MFFKVVYSFFCDIFDAKESCLINQIGCRLFNLRFPVIGFKPIIVARLEPAFGVTNSDPVIEKIYKIRITFTNCEPDGFTGEV